jgi:F-type H+-transporting ATPase subunit b
MEAIIPKGPEILVALVSFLVLFFVLAKYAFPPLTNMLEERAATIHESLTRAEEARIEAERLLEEYKAQLAESRQEAAGIVGQAKKIAETARAELLAKAQADAEGIVEKARQAIEAEKRSAIAELQVSVADLSVAVAGRIIGAKLTKDDHLELIEKYVAEAGGLNAN